MADQNVTEGISEVGKLVGSAGGGGIVTLLLSRLFGGQDKVLGRLDAIQTSLTTMAKEFAVASDRMAQDRSDISELKSEMKQLRDEVTTLRVTVKQLSEGSGLVE